MDVYNILYEQALSPAALDFLESSAMTKYNTMEIGERISSIMQSPYYSRQAIQHSLELGCVDYIKLSENLTIGQTQHARIQGIHFLGRTIGLSE